MSSGPTSLEAAHADVIDSSESVDAGRGAVLGMESEPQQLDLLRDEDGKLPSNVFRLLRQEPEKARGPGRPKGSRNKASDDLAKLIGHKYGNPVEFQASIYAMPLDQLVELLQVADGTIERRDRIEELLVGLAEKVEALGTRQGHVMMPEDYRALTKACDSLATAASKLQGKPGDLALKALNLQLLSASRVSEYTDSKKPTEHKVDFNAIPTIVMPGVGAAENFDEADRVTRIAGDLLARALRNGRIEPQQIVGLQLQNGQFVIEGHAVEVGDDDEGEDGDNA